jgi:hypothetical protein
MSGRANAALNILHLSGAFALQYLTGVIVSCWPPISGHPPAEAYEAAFGFSVILQLLALLWFLGSTRLARIPRFSASRRPAWQTSPSEARSREYAIAGLAIASHIAAARAQVAHWRLIGIASATLCASLVTLTVLRAQSGPVVHVIEMSSLVAVEDDRHPQDARLVMVSVTGALRRER